MQRKKHHYFALIWFKAIAELHAEAARAYVGFVWWVAEPVLYMLAFYVVFGLVLGRGGEDFVPFLLCGLVAWKWFATTVMTSTNAIPANAGLMQQVYLPKYLFPAVMVTTNTLKFLVVFLLLIAFLIFYGYVPSAIWLYLPLIVFVQLLFVAGVAGIVSSVVPFFPDLKLLIENLVMLLMFMSGIFFDVKSAAAEWQTWLMLNPMLGIIDSYRDVLMFNKAPDLMYLGIVLGCSLLLLLVSYWILNKYDRIYPRVIV